MLPHYNAEFNHVGM